MRRATLLLYSVLTIGRVAHAGDLTGDVFVVMASGDVKRGADVRVMLVAVTSASQADWNRAIEPLLEDRRQAEVDLRAGRQAVGRAEGDRRRAVELVARTQAEGGVEYRQARVREDAAFEAAARATRDVTSARRRVVDVSS